MNKKRIFKASACLLLACALMLSMCSCAFWKKTFAKPNEYMAYVEEEALASAVNSFAEAYDKALASYKEPKTSGAKSELQISLGTSVAQLLKSYTGIDFDWINDTTIKVDSVTGKDAAKYALSLVLGDDTLISLDAVADIAGGGIYFKIAELTEKYLFLDLGTDVVPEAAASLDVEKLIEKLPDGKELADLIMKYAGIVFDNVNEAEKTKGSVTANDKTEECTILEATLSEADVKALVKAVLFELQRDTEIEKLIRTSIEVMNEVTGTAEMLDADEAYADFVGEVNALINDIDDDDTSDDVDEMIRYTTYVNSDSEVIARKLWAYEFGEIFIGTAYEKDEFGTEISIKEYSYTDEELYTVLEIKGEGTSKKDVVNGEYDLYVEGELIATLAVSNLDVKALEKNQLKGGFTVYPSAKLFESDETGMLALIGSSLGIGMDFDYEDGKQSIKIFANSMENELISVKVTSEEVKGSKVSIPAESETMEDPDAWLESVSFGTFLENLKNSELPAEITSLLELLVTMLSY